MNRDRSSRRLKSSSNNSIAALDRDPYYGAGRTPFFITVLWLLCLVGIGCGEPMRRLPPQNGSSHSAVLTPPPSSGASDTVIPPWQLWSAEPSGFPGLDTASSLEAQGKFTLAVQSYRDVELRAAPGREREEAFARRIGLLLKLGRSKEALQQITSHLKEENRSADQISPILALLAAFAYEHESDWDQTFAWLGVAHKRSQGQGMVARRALLEAERVLRALPEDRFGTTEQVWGTDAFVGSIVARERSRRSQGGRVEPLGGKDFFRPETYGAGRESGEVREGDLAPSTLAPQPSGPAAVGVLLPLSGKFADSAAKVKQGIELAHELSNSTVPIAYGDTAGEPTQAESEYVRLAQQGAVVILGPLLVKTTEQVAQRSQTVHVPFVTFTKRPGVTDLSPVAFRLGATAENQLSESVRYAVDELHAKTFVLLAPAGDTSADEFAKAFSHAVSSAGGTAAGTVLYRARDDDAARSAVQQVESIKPDAIFLADELDKASAVLRSLKNSSVSKSTILGPALWNDAVALRAFSSYLEGAVFVTPFFARSAKPKVTDFVSAYRQRYGGEPDLLAAQAFDVASLVFRLLGTTASGSTATGANPQAISDALMKGLQSTDTYDGITGKLTVGKNRDISRRMSVVRMYHGEAVEVMNGGNVTGFLPNEPTQKETGT